ncbi:MAG TPA: bifunctional [glutamine synthetase] adenylyltransferase/[glutamine synthetase]-adenylyl-L-tyrosine phosphorylase, partial [Kaistiaceae bacterium]|nr:bifunctional [glutamine synthetase] adenylyltransferase/[glutamine synthetase]-adenylyl-L-tyrosine phosphorylase [Kaistiaceae bacterium]
MNEAAGAPKGIATEDRRLFTRISVVPAVRDAALAERLTAELIENARAAEGGEAMARLVESKPLVRDFLAGVMECSPYLRDLALRDPLRLARVLKSDPAARMEEMCAAARVAHRAATGEADLMRLLRQFKQEAALVIGLADLAGAWSVDEVTRALTDTADSALTASMRFLLTEAVAGGKFTPVDADEPERGCGLIILAMGKHGAYELNYSSDIDLIVFYDFVRAPLAEGVEPSTFWIRLTKRLVKIMQERNEYGYVFRTDLRLRPDPGATAVAISLDAAIAYYESMGQNWERAALIKARPCAGDIAAGDDFLQEISPFIWRKYLDYAAIADVHSIKRQIHAHKGHAAIAVAGHNIKLGRGGIREIEFFVQTQQL